MAEEELKPPSLDEMLDAARRAELTWRTFRYASDTIAAVVQARNDLPDALSKVTAAEKQLNAIQGKVDVAKAEAEVECSKIDELLKDKRQLVEQHKKESETAFRHIAAEIAAANKELAGVQAQLSAKKTALEKECADQQAKLRQETDALKAAMAKEVEAIQAKIDALNEIARSKRDAVLALAE